MKVEITIKVTLWGYSLSDMITRSYQAVPVELRLIATHTLRIIVGV